MKKFIRYTMVIAIILVIAIGLYYVACIVRTPEITGIVIDKENKKPVENAWIMAVVETNTRTFGGDVSVHYLITPPHTRTDKTGRFSIPSRTYYSSPPPLGWGMSKTRLRIDVYGPEGKRGAIDLYTKTVSPKPVPHDREASIEPKSSIKESKLILRIPIKEIPMTDKEVWDDLGTITGYCQTGRYDFAIPAFTKPCDSWELDYVIERREYLGDRLSYPRSAQEIAGYSGYLRSLASLYRIKGDPHIALSYYVRVHDFDQKHGLTLNLNEYKAKISELRKELGR